MTRSRELAEFATAYDTGGYSHFKNRIINGAMMIDQRNAGAAVTANTNGQYSVDRFQCRLTQTGKYAVAQKNGVNSGASNYEAGSSPEGFINSLKAASLSAYSVLASDTFTIGQSIEGLNISDLGWGTVNAQPVTVSFWVKSSLTGTFGGAIRNSGATRSYPFSYTVSAANTWEQKTVSISGDTSGSWSTDNGIGINLAFSLGAGSTFSGTAGSWSSSNYVSATGATSVVGTNGATFYITGVQLEKGSTATSFDYRPYGTELALCKAYMQDLILTSFRGYNAGAGNYLSSQLTLPVKMRAVPTGSVVVQPASTANISGSLNVSDTTVDCVSIGFSGAAAGQSFYNSAVVRLVSEL